MQRRLGRSKPVTAFAHKFCPSVGSKWATLLVGADSGGAKLAGQADVGYTTNSGEPVNLPDYYAVGKPLADEMTEIVYDLEVRQNRPDCLGVVGLCRDLAASLGSLDDPSWVQPDMQFWTERQQAWGKIPADITTFARNPPQA